MIYMGHVENGVVLFDGPARPPEGMAVRIEEEPANRAAFDLTSLDRMADMINLDYDAIEDLRDRIVR